MDSQSNKPLISIVLLSLLRQAETARCIESIFAYTDIALEIIVVDMGQSSEIAEWLGRLAGEKSNIRVVFNSENIGTTRGRNQGIRAANGEWVVFLDNDAEVTSHWLQPLLAVAESRLEVVACGPKVVSPSGKVMNCAGFVRAHFQHGKLTEIGLEFLTDYRTDAPEVNQLCQVPWYSTTCLLVKKSALDAVGGFDETFFLCEEDKDLSLRLRDGGGEIYYVPESVVVHHHVPSSAEYGRIRNNTAVLLKDIRAFEAKWGSKVVIRHSRTYLHRKGMSDKEIDRIKKLSLFNTVVESEIELNQLIVTVTNQCTHSCGYCYYSSNLNTPSDHLTIEEYQRIASSIGKLSILWVTGGEPFLQRDLPDICRTFVSTNQVRHIFIPTNGSHPGRIVEHTRRILEQNVDVRVTLMFSLEGLPKTHDEIHGRVGAFAQVIESIKRINFLRLKFIKEGRSFNILLNTVVSNKNLHQIADLMAYANSNLLIDAHTVSPMRGSGPDSAFQPPSGEELRLLYEQAKPYFESYATRARLSDEKSRDYLDWLNRRYSVWSDVLDGNELPFNCQAGRLIGVLEPDGGIRVCESKPVVANIREYGYDFPRAWFSAAADQSRLTVQGCSCTHACFINASDLLGG